MTAPAVTLDPSETMVGTANGVGLWIAPEGTPAPADGAPFAAPWRPLGYASDDGPTIGGDTTSEAITPWQSRSPIRTIITERSLTIAFVLWQINQDTLGLYFQTEVPAATPEGGYSFDVRSDGGSKVYAIGLDVKDGDNSFRVCFKRATLDSTGDMQIQKGAMLPLDVTLAALDDAGVLAHVDVTSGGAPAGGLLVTATPVDEPAAATPPAPAPDASGVTTGPAADADNPSATTDASTTGTGDAGTGDAGTTGGAP